MHLRRPRGELASDLLVQRGDLQSTLARTEIVLQVWVGIDADKAGIDAVCELERRLA